MTTIVVGLLGCALCGWAGYRYGRATQRRAQAAHDEHIRRVTAVPGRAHRGPANMDAEPSRVTSAKYRQRRRWGEQD